MISAAVVMLVTYYSRTDDADRDALFICVHDAEPHGFLIPIREVEAMTDGGGQIFCTICGSDEVYNATTCPHCEAPVVQGVHGITPPNCWKCDGRLPNGDLDMFHTGAH